eukprot:TRINITY_DN27698_c0_g1_i1.p1 TRINITY_DN27698_c0_g1~~TRINITY_DN27698_c0_g1_i1.p1  ORF type:complete len:1128 (+),score=218.92 TRINITY_DN27698_c0_g1_i1:491-3385(+)
MDSNDIATMLNIMNQNPYFVSQHECIIFWRAFLSYYPEREDELVARVKDRRFDIGGTFTEGFEEMMYNELMVRQIYNGRKWFIERYPELENLTAQVAFHQDGPLRALQMPQVYKKSGLKYLKASRLSDNFFKWASPDGSYLIAFEETHYGQEDPDGTGYMYPITTDIITRRMNYWAAEYQKNGMEPTFALTVGSDYYSPRLYPEFTEDWMGINTEPTPSPIVTWSNFNNYLSSLDESKLPTYGGERPNLWWVETSPTHHHMFSDLREASKKLPAVEMFSSFISLIDPTYKYPKDMLDVAWLNITVLDHGLGHEPMPDMDGHLPWLANNKSPKFADYVYQQKWSTAAVAAAKQLDGTLKDITQRIKSVATSEKQTVTVFNPLSWTRTGDPVEILVPKGKINNDTIAVVTDIFTGQNVTCQTTVNGTIVFSSLSVPSLGYRSYEYKLINAPKSRKSPPTRKLKSGDVIENKFFKITPGKGGGLKSVIDLETQKELFDTSKLLAGEWLSLKYTSNGASETQVYGYDDRIPVWSSRSQRLSNISKSGPPPDGVKWEWVKESHHYIQNATEGPLVPYTFLDMFGCNSSILTNFSVCEWNNATQAKKECARWNECGGFQCNNTRCYARYHTTPVADNSTEKANNSWTAYVKRWNDSNTNAIWKLVEEGPVRTVLETESAQTLHSMVKLSVILYHNIKRIDFRTHINNWNSTFGVTNRIVFPLRDTTKSRNITIGVPFGRVRVGKDEIEDGQLDTWLLKPGPTVDKFERCWAMRPREITEWVHANTNESAITFSSSISMIDWSDASGNYNTNQTVIGGEGLMHTYSNQGPFLDESGNHFFSFSLFSAKDPKSNPQWKLAVQAEQPLLTIVNNVNEKKKVTSTDPTLPPTMSFLNVTSPNVWITAFKKKDVGPGYIIRMFDNEGVSTSTNINLLKPIKGISTTTMIEQHPQPLQTEKLSITPWSIETFLLDL